MFIEVHSQSRTMVLQTSITPEPGAWEGEGFFYSEFLLESLTLFQTIVTVFDLPYCLLDQTSVEDLSPYSIQVKTIKLYLFFWTSR